MPNPFKNLLLSYSILEVACFVLIAHAIGTGTALLLLIASSALGLFILRKAATTTLNATVITQQLQVNAWREVLDARYVVIGLLFLVPGFLTDIIALLCLIPVAHRQLLKWFGKKEHYSANDHIYHAEPRTTEEQKTTRIIEGECWREDEK